MSFIVTFELNREQESFWQLESLDELPKVMADHIDEYREDYDFEYDGPLITGIFEILKEIELREPTKKKYDLGELTQQMKDILAQSKIELDNIRLERKRQREENQKKLEEAEFKRLKKKLGK